MAAVSKPRIVVGLVDKCFLSTLDVLGGEEVVTSSGGSRDQETWF